VLHLATGNEIVPPDIVPACGQIRDSNSTLVSAFCGARGIRPRQQRVAEDYDHALAAVRQAAGGGEWPDLMLISGGASVGEHDFTRRLFENLGYEIIIARTSSRPGKPLIVARREASLAFGLPGNPLAHYVGLHVFVQAALDRFAGLPAAPPLLEGILSEAIDNGVDGRESFWPARHFQTGSECHLQPLRWISSGDVSSMGLASALIRLPAGTSRLAAGSRVAFVSTIATT
jgi:molybdopterin molybdotransferase